MSNIKKLLEGVEVEWKTLGEIAENVSSGGTPNTGVEDREAADVALQANITDEETARIEALAGCS